MECFSAACILLGIKMESSYCIGNRSMHFEIKIECLLSIPYSKLEQYSILLDDWLKWLVYKQLLIDQWKEYCLFVRIH